ncbi:phosphotransferase system sugar-specific permease eiia type 1 [Lucifera butyrica]|uniref:Phosphotransferase system sugar-specific permease eiia type 1 n=1 Tax=Lucifera butyrica TaxID=1351585 RepID=A0A498R8A2_9FIRM|nr:PTS glucose transporter subunit IIA [Lucifera butyrica]VBB05368.1 phosphotransferase system sugar-specific permease eiia type 1 [Lucifera butyrica]
MFNFFSKQAPTLQLVKPVDGSLMDIKDVPDPVFNQLYMGDGVAVNPEGNVITAPCAGEVVLVAKTLHAVALRAANGVEILIHIGLDTVHLQGEGFTGHVKTGDMVKQGDALISFDRAYIEQQGKSLITPVVITNMDEKVKSIKKFTDRQDQVIMEISAK